MDKFRILNEIKKHYAFKRDTDFALKKEQTEIKLNGVIKRKK